VQAAVQPLDLSPADWQWLRDQETAWQSIVVKQRRSRPQVYLIYQELFSGVSGERLKRRATDHQLLMQLRRLAEGAKLCSGRSKHHFWEAVWQDLRSSGARHSWPAVSKLVGRRVALNSTNVVPNDWRTVPPIWRSVVAAASERAVERATMRTAIKYWHNPQQWLNVQRQTVVITNRLTDWLSGWSDLKQALSAAQPGRTTDTRRRAWVAMREFYWHELTRGLSEAELMVMGIDLAERAAIRRQITELNLNTPEQTTGRLQRDVTVLSGRHAKIGASWHRQTIGRRWSQLKNQHLNIQQATALVDAWGQTIVGPSWSQWTVVVEEEADSWRVDTAERRVILPAKPVLWSAAELVPIIAHELTHVWQTEQGARLGGRSLTIWGEAASSTQPLAEAGAMRTERAVRQYLGGPDQSRLYYLLGLQARRHGSSFGVVMAAVARGIAHQEGWRLSRVPTPRRRELARQAFRRTLRLYRPTLPLSASRRLLNEDQLKYVESELLASDLQHSGLEPLLSVNTVDLVRWPLYRRLGYNLAAIECFPINEMLSIIGKTVDRLI